MELPKLWGLASLSVNAKTTVHEFGHALGFGHEYARADAPYDDNCALQGADDQRYVEEDRPITSFDFDSIMVACIKGATLAFSTGVPRLSAADIYGAVKTYGSAEHNVLDRDEPGDLFGKSLAIGDFDGDSVPDLAVGAPGETLNQGTEREGAVYLYRGDAVRGLRPWGRLTAMQEDAPALGFGSRMLADRLDDDRYDDLIVASENGQTFAFRGRPSEPPERWSDSPSHPGSADIKGQTIDGIEVGPFDIDDPSDDVAFGEAALLADLDGDGHQDLIVSAPLASIGNVPSGQVFVYLSPKVERPWKKPPKDFIPWYRFGQAY